MYKENIDLGVSKNRGGTPKSSMLIGVSIVNHPFWGALIFAPIFGNIQFFQKQKKIQDDHILYIHSEHHPKLSAILLVKTESMEVENYLKRKKLMLEVPIFYWTMIVGGKVSIIWAASPPSNCGKWRLDGWDPLLKMVHNPGGDWHPGRGTTQSIIKKTGGYTLQIGFNNSSMRW